MSRIFVPVIIAALAGCQHVDVQTAEPCGFGRAFERPDERGRESVAVYEGRPDAAIGGNRPLAFVSSLKVNTDGTRISYKVDDPRARNGAINNIANALRQGQTIADFEAIAAARWEPESRTWRILSKKVIEQHSGTKKPCVAPDNYLVSMTADVAVADGWNRQGDCDQSKWIDALTIPALVLPGDSPNQFDARTATTRSFVVVMTLEGPRRLAYGIVGDKGPDDELGEASVEMNRMLNGLPDGSVPRNYKDAVDHYQAPRSIILIFPGTANRLAYPITPDRVRQAVTERFEAWGGEARLAACRAEIPEPR